MLLARNDMQWPKMGNTKAVDWQLSHMWNAANCPHLSAVSCRVSPHSPPEVAKALKRFGQQAARSMKLAFFFCTHISFCCCCLFSIFLLCSAVSSLVQCFWLFLSRIFSFHNDQKRQRSQKCFWSSLSPAEPGGAGDRGKGESAIAKGAVHWPRHAMRVFCLPHDQVQQRQQQLADSAVFFLAFFALRLAWISASTSTLTVALALFWPAD